MTEQQAWLALAKLWDKPLLEFWCDDYAVILDNRPRYGLCGCIAGLPISDWMRERMRRKACGRTQLGRYRWQLDARGARSRAAFCRKMAAQCGRKR